MPNAIKKSNEEIHTMLQIARMLKLARGRDLNTVQKAVYVKVTHAAIADASAELFGA